MTSAPTFLSMEALEAGMEQILLSPTDRGTLEMIVRRPRREEREVLHEGNLDPAEGLVGDSWKTRVNGATPDVSVNVDTQVTLMNARVIALIAQEKTFGRS